MELDLYAYLWHDGVLSVQINLPEHTAALPNGAGLLGRSVESVPEPTGNSSSQTQPSPHSLLF